MKEKNFFNLKDMVLMALFAALTCVLAPLAVPIGPVPISLTNLVIYFSLYVLGWQRATITYIVYLLLGLVGLPVFSGFEGGVGKVAGPTGGYLIGFIFMAIVCGLLMQVKKDKKIVNIVFCVVGMLIGTAIAYAFGTMWFCYSTGTGLGAAMALCVIPFIPGDLIKIAIAAVVAPTVANQINEFKKRFKLKRSSSPCTTVFTRKRHG